MAHPALTTVVVINHNYARFLRQSVWSVVQQTRAPSVLVIDDASSDESGAVLASLEAAHPEIAAVRLRENVGLSRVRNLAASHATTEWIVFLDADDWLEPTYVEQAEAALARSPDIHVLVPDMTLVRGDRRPRLVRSRIPRDWRELLKRNTIVQTSFLRRELVNTLGGYDPQLDFEDWDFWVRALKAGGRFARLPGAFVNRREHGANKSKVCDEAVATAAVRLKHRSTDQQS
jgi:glycosyltransferase involved in cell wall biosynthesis